MTYVIKCLTVLVVLVGLVVMWILYRKKTNQIMLITALSILTMGTYRLFQVKNDSDSMLTVAIIFGGLAVVYLASWISNRMSMKKEHKQD